jgi:hypothetical protein
VPPVKTNSSGSDFSTEGTVSIDFSDVYVTKSTDTAAIINEQLAAGLSVVVSPGIYQIEAPLVVGKKGQVILGLGFATLVASKQNVIISVGDVDDVRIAGLLLQAGPPGSTNTTSPALLQWGNGGYAGTASAPGVVSDVFGRVGGPDGTAASPVAADIMFHIKSGNVIVDDTWLWRADHAAGAAVTYESNRCQHGLVVDGDDVVAYGLAVEHVEQDLTIWNGNNGKVFFYQSGVYLPPSLLVDHFSWWSPSFSVCHRCLLSNRCARCGVRTAVRCDAGRVW